MTLVEDHHEELRRLLGSRQCWGLALRGKRQMLPGLIQSLKTAIRAREILAFVVLLEPGDEEHFVVLHFIRWERKPEEVLEKFGCTDPYVIEGVYDTREIPVVLSHKGIGRLVNDYLQGRTCDQAAVEV